MNRDDLLAKWSEPVRVLDHGHVRLVDVMGSDEDIEAVARLSYQRGTRKVSETRALLRYLMRNRHTSPFEQAVIKLDMKIPIFVARQLVRHRTQSLNELSGRYSELPEEFYVPEPEQVCYQSTTNRQGREGQMDERDTTAFVTSLREVDKHAFDVYHAALERGVARETARFVLPVNVYTQWCTTMNAHNLLHLLGLRLDEHAQWEVRQFAQVIADIVKDWLPLTWEAFEDYRLGSITFSRQEMELVKLIGRWVGSLGNPAEALRAEAARQGLSPRETNEFLAVLGL